MFANLVVVCLRRALPGLLLPVAVCAQLLPKPNVDSLQRLLPTLSDTAKVNLLKKLSTATFVAGQDSLSFAYTRQAMTKSRQLNYTKGLVDAYHSLSLLHQKATFYDSSTTWV